MNLSSDAYALLDEKYGLNRLDIDGLLNVFEKSGGDGENEFVASVIDWFNDGSSRYYDRWLVSTAQLEDIYEIGYADGVEGEEMQPSSAIEYVAARRVL